MSFTFQIINDVHTRFRHVSSVDHGQHYGEAFGFGQSLDLLEIQRERF